MASTALVRDVLWRVSLLLKDTNPQFAFWSENELVQWLMDAQASITKFLPLACTRIDALKLRAGTQQSIDTIAAADCLPGDGSTPTAPIHGKQLMKVLCLMGADGLTPGRALRLVDHEQLDALNPDWHTLTGTPTQYAWDARSAKTYFVTRGVPAGTTLWAKVMYAASPLPIDNSGTAGSPRYLHGTSTATDTITVDDENVDELIHYVVARAHMKDAKFADPSVSAAFTSMFTASLNARVQAITGNSPKLASLPMPG